MTSSVSVSVPGPSSTIQKTFEYSGKKPEFFRDQIGDTKFLLQEFCTNGSSQLRAEVHGDLLISSKFVFIGELNLFVNAVVEGYILFDTSREGSVGGKLNFSVNAKIDGDVEFRDRTIGGFCTKRVSIDGTQKQSLRIVFEGRLNVLKEIDVHIDATTVDVKSEGKYSKEDFSISDTIVEGDSGRMRIITIGT